MKRAKKIHTQGTGKEENRVDNILPDRGESALTDDQENVGASAQIPGEAFNKGNQVLADIVVGKEGNSNTDAFHNNNTTNTYAQEVDVNTGGVALEQSPGATNTGDNPSNTELAATPFEDKEILSRWADEDAEKQTGRPTGAIYGSGGDSMAVNNPASSKSATPKATAKSTKKRAAPIPAGILTRVYGHIHMEGNSYFLKAGNVPHGQLQLLAPNELKDRMARYDGQVVSIAGELTKKNKGDMYATLSIRALASHEEIGHRAYELSHQNPDAQEDNWLQAESELLQS